MRQRSTWNKDRQAATSRTADIYEMNQEHPQPSPTEYENGDPNSWAETPTKNEYVKQSYDGDHEARNEIGLAEFAPSTFDHKDSKEWAGSGKYDNQRGGMTASSRKATAAERIARAVLRTANTELVQAQAVDFMNLPDTVLVATMKRLDQVSPNALSKEVKLRRSYACCKLAGSMIPSKESYASEEQWAGLIENLGRTLMTLDDPTLKSLIKTSVEANKLAIASDEEDEKEEKTSSAKKDEDEKEEKTSSMKEDEEHEDTTASSEEEDCDEHTSGMEHEEGCMSGDDMAMLDSMLGTPAAAPCAPAPDLVPAPAPLTDLFEEAVPVVGLPGVASDNFDISFDDGDDARVASDGDDLDSVFSDNDEVQAQREIRAAHADQVARERGFQNGRTASEGAKRLGTVVRISESKDELDSIWT